MQIFKNKQKNLLIIVSIFLVAILSCLYIKDITVFLKTDTGKNGVVQIQVAESQDIDELRFLTKDISTVINSQEPKINIVSNINASIKYNSNNLKVNDWTVFELQQVEGYYVEKVTVNGLRVTVIGNKFEIVLSETNDIYVEYEKYDNEKERTWLFDMFIIVFVLILVVGIPLTIILIMKKRKRI